MTRLLSIVAVVVLVCPAYGQSITFTGPVRESLLEEQSYTITWSSAGISTVNLLITGTRTPLGNQPRGDFSAVLAQSLAADQGQFDLVMPWVDSIAFNLVLQACDDQGKVICTDQRQYGFRPEILARRTADGIYLDLHLKTNQRLYVQQNHRITKVYLSSSSEAYYWLPPNQHVSGPHDHAGVYSVIEKKPVHHSVLFNVDMPYALRYHGGHFIHATIVSEYPWLGVPASHGCNRMTLEDARALYQSTPLGTRVEIIGPDG